MCPEHLRTISTEQVHKRARHRNTASIQYYLFSDIHLFFNCSFLRHLLAVLRVLSSEKSLGQQKTTWTKMTLSFWLTCQTISRQPRCTLSSPPCCPVKKSCTTTKEYFIGQFADNSNNSVHSVGFRPSHYTALNTYLQTKTPILLKDCTVQQGRYPGTKERLFFPLERQFFPHRFQNGSTVDTSPSANKPLRIPSHR